MADSSVKLRIKKSRSVSLRGFSSWIGVEMEEEFSESELDTKTAEIISHVDGILSDQERRERDILEDRILGGF